LSSPTDGRRRVTYVCRFPNDKLVFKLLVGLMTTMVVIETVSFAVEVQTSSPNTVAESQALAGYQLFMDMGLGMR
jgi:hypothetical protein